MRKFIILPLLLLISAQSFAALNNVVEEDGSPSTYPWKLKVTNGTLTDNGDGSASLTTGGGAGGVTVGGAITSGTANRVLFEDAGNLLAESADFTFTGATSQLAVTGTTTLTAKTATTVPLILNAHASQSQPLVRMAMGIQTVTTTIANTGSLTFDASGNGGFMFSDPISVTAPSTTAVSATFTGPASSTADQVVIRLGASQSGTPLRVYDSSKVELMRFGITGSQGGADLVFAGGSGSQMEIRTTGSGSILMSGITGQANFNTVNLAGAFTVDGDNLDNVLAINNASFADRVGIVTTGPARALDINDASGNALRLTYNDNNGSATTYADFLISSIGVLTISPTSTQTNVTGSLNTTTGATFGSLTTNLTTRINSSGTLTVGSMNVQTVPFEFNVSSAIAASTTTSGGNCAGDLVLTIPAKLNGAKVTTVLASVSTVNSSGLLTANIRNRTNDANVLSTAVTIDASEFNSTTAATPAVINQSTNTLTTGDQLCVQVSETGTGHFGLNIAVEANR